MDDEDEGEYAEVNGVAGKGGVVLHRGPRGGAGVEGAEPGFIIEGCICVSGGGIVHVDLGKELG